MIHEGENIQSHKVWKFLGREVPFVEILTKGKIQLTWREKETIVWKHRWFIYKDSHWNSCFTEQISMKTFLELYSQEINNSQFWIQTSNQVKDIICIGHSRSGFVRVDHKALLHHCTEETISSKNILALPFLKGRVLQLGDRSKATPQCLPRY